MMMRKRKTIEVQLIRERANEFFANSADNKVEARNAVQSFVASLLMQTSNYKGYNALYWLKQGCREWEESGKPDFPQKTKFFGDESRIYFY